MIWTALTSRIAGPVATAVAIALACFLLAVSIQNAGLKAKVKDQAREIANLQVDLRQCQANRVTLEASIADQNAAIARAKAEAKARDEAARKAVRDARQQTAKADREIARIMAARPGQDACESAERLILESLR